MTATLAQPNLAALLRECRSRLPDDDALLGRIDAALADTPERRAAARVARIRAAHRLTERQADVLRMIAEQLERDGTSPTLAEIAGVLNVSTVTVFEHVVALKKKGVLQGEAKKYRSLRFAANGNGEGSDGK